MKNAKEFIDNLEKQYCDKQKPGDWEGYNFLRIAVNDDAILSPEQEVALEIIFGSFNNPSNRTEILQIATWINSCH